MSEFTLEAVRPADREVWSALWRAYLEFYGTTRDAATYEAAFTQLLSEDPASFRGKLAWVGDAARGLVHWVWHPHMWHAQGVIYLQDLFVAPEARGTGLGRALIETVYADADTRGCGVYWLTQTGNPARALYDRVAERTDFIKYQRRVA